MEKTLADKFTYPEMLQHMRECNIAFNIMSEKEAREFIDSGSYYFKLQEFCHNFPRQNGKYKQLEFAYLADLAVVDFQLRTFLMEISLGVEMGIRTFLNDSLTMNSNKDGYEIVEEFARLHPQMFKKAMSYFKQNHYTVDLYNHTKDHVPVWIFLEEASFGVLTQFLDFYNTKYPSKTGSKVLGFIKYATNIRNAAAHNNPILVNLFSKREYLNHQSTAVTDAARAMDISYKDIRDMKVNDLVSLFEVFDLLAADVVKENAKQSGIAFINRFNQHIDYYDQLPNLLRFKAILENLINHISIE